MNFKPHFLRVKLKHLDSALKKRREVRAKVNEFTAREVERNHAA